MLEAEQFTANLSRNGQSWSLLDHLEGYTGTGYVTVEPDRDVLYNETELNTAPELQYTLSFSTTGTYQVWLRGAGANGAGDSVYLALVPQGSQPGAPLAISGFLPGRWNWSQQTLEGLPATVTVKTVGPYTLYVWPREDGVRLDRLLLSSNPYYYPVGVGPHPTSP